MRLVTVIGARPQFIKAAILSQEIRRQNKIDEVIIHTGQHFDLNMSEVFFDELNIPKPTFNLGISSSSHGKMTGQMLESLEIRFLETAPNCVLVYGDTNSTLAASLTAAKLLIPVVHVEAGLRSFNRSMPEEINRVVTDHVSSVLFTPTLTATTNLRNEGIDANKIFQVGDVMYDVALQFGEIATQRSRVLETNNLKQRSFVLVTIHRQENTDNLQRLRVICESLYEVSKQVQVVLPLHPRTQSKIKEYHLENLLENVLVLSPVGYLDMIQLERNASVIATDSGGVQKEAYFYRVPCVTLRDETEWIELVDSGWNVLASPRGGEIVETILNSIGRVGKNINLYGDGKTSQRIHNVLAGRE